MTSQVEMTRQGWRAQRPANFARAPRMGNPASLFQDVRVNEISHGRSTSLKVGAESSNGRLGVPAGPGVGSGGANSVPRSRRAFGELDRP